MPNQLLVNPHPYGVDNTQKDWVVDGSLILAGAATAAGEPINFSSMITGIGYNEKNFRGYGGSGVGTNNASALVTALAASSGTITATANNNFSVGQKVTFVGLTSTLGLLLNGLTVVLTAVSATTFAFVNASTGTGTGETGMAVSGDKVLVQAASGNKQTSSYTAVTASGGIITVTAPNTFLPGAVVQFQTGSTGLAAALVGLSFTVLSATATAFTFASALTGATGTGIFSGFNCAQPYTVDFWSQGASGYIYSYNENTGTLFVQQGGAAVSNPFANLPAAAYPAAVLGDVIKLKAWFARGV